MKEYKEFRKILKEEEKSLGDFDSHQIMESKMKEIDNSERNSV